MYAHVKVAVIYHGETEQVCRLALAASEGAWDAGGEVRLRRLGRPAPSGTPFDAVPRTERIPAARPADLAWADVALFGMATPYGVTLDPLTRFIDAAVPLWRAGRLAEKVYGAFTAAASAHGGPGRRLVSLTDVFHHWGGIIVPLATPGSSVEAQLAAAQCQVQRATETAGALKVRQRLLADVA